MVVNQVARPTLWYLTGTLIGQSSKDTENKLALTVASLQQQQF